MSFPSKTVCAVGCGSGVGAGGVTAHQNSLPYTWREYLDKDGITFLERDYDYQGIFYDQKDGLKTDNVITATDKVVAGALKIKKWCEDELEKSYKSDNNIQEKREKIIKYCSITGVTTVKGKLGQINQVNWIEDSDDNKDDAYKTIFAVYRYDNNFIEWLNDGQTDANEKVKQTDKPSEKHSKLKTKCETKLKLEFEKVTYNQEYGYVSWWCQSLTYKTVKDKLEREPGGYKERTDWESAAAIWNEVETVKNKVKGSESNDPDKEKYKSWCQSETAKELKEDDVFKDKYQIALTICKA